MKFMSEKYALWSIDITMFYAHWKPSHDANLVATDVTGGCRYGNCQTHCDDKSGILAISHLNWGKFLN